MGQIVTGIAQSYQPIGQHFLYNFSAKKYKSNTQNFDILEGNNNLMYFANQGGLLEFDGEEWRTIKITNQECHALCKNEKGEIYVGGANNFGVLQSNDKGILEYKSISDDLKDNEIPSIENVIYHNEWVYFFPNMFEVDNMFFAYSEKEKKSYKIITPFKLVFNGLANHKIILQFDNGEIYDVKGKEIKLLSNDEKWKDIFISSLVKIGDLTFVYAANNMYITDKKWNNPTLYNELKLPDDLRSIIYFKNKIIAAKKGLLVFDITGKLLFPISKFNGLVDNNINKLFIDSQENLWVATENGISIVDVNNTLTFFNFNDGIDGTVTNISKFKNHIIVETKSGIFELKNSMDISSNNAFEKLTGVPNSPYGSTTFLENGDSVHIVGDFYGVLKRTGENSFTRIFECAPNKVLNCQNKPNRLLIADASEGLIILQYENGKYNPYYIDELHDVNVIRLFEDVHGDYWLSDARNGVYHLTEKKNDKPSFEVTVYDQKTGLPEGFTNVFRFNEQLFFGTEKGFYEIKNGKFFESEVLKLDFADEYSIHRSKVDLKGNLWISAYDVNDIKRYFTGYAKMTNGKVHWISKPFFKASEEKIDIFFHEDHFVTWFGGPDGLFRYDKRNPENFNRKYKILLREFSTSEGNILYGGSGKYNESQFVFPFGETKYFFEFSATHYKTENGMRYSYWLEGQDKDWSEFSTINSIDFQNLYEGDYVLHVKGIDDFGNKSEEFKISFIILAPFYRTSWAYLLYFVIFVLIIIGAVRISSNGLKKIIRQRTKEIEEQKHIVEEKNKEIIDSISYAKRLQQAILPSNKLIQDVLPPNFILYKPKDIVAGDFYWMEKVGDWVLFAVCDCTGHGVPGAMVSVVGANSLNRCVNEFKLSEPAAILDKLTFLVEETFSKSEGEVRDGMDMSLCAFNSKTLEIKWAGANNPIWYIREKEIIEIKGDKQPIGKYENRKPFTQHTIQLQKGDRFYLFTDGYADQFGGEKGKKFKYSQLKESLLNNHLMDIKIQHEVLDEIFESWRSNMEQTDDVCLWGISL